MENKEYSRAGVVFLTPDFARFKKCGDFVGLELSGDLSKLASSALEVRRLPSYDRVLLRRAFPFVLKDKYVSVLDTDRSEIGLIEDINIFPREQAELLNAELERVYYCPEILKITSVKERPSHSYFSVVCTDGEKEIPLRDVYRSIIKISDDRLIIIDADGNRYSISSLKALDKNSRRKLELYI